ncbi:ubiquitin conjugating enzyme e2 [Diplodia corticola]|uniref:Ubiquitin-conjugating enzyme E2 2 n=1 Tax=Diplodia corticola TaxID=236234 RepID=A0A1J9RYQ7_9PEZI|nr:ubiquitin conjugating enzyme e2 [Diplodia corticola]OJD37803.1 ubiquitin conjugating enzyme e2 [Diplodia corticola]
MNSRSLRRLAGDHATLHADLPPNYLFAPHTDSSDDLTQLDVLLAGPEGTPYAAGVYRLHLEMPATYPSAPPTAHFRTRIWHPNVEETTGAVCVDTLKRDWQAGLTLRDVLVTISCLLIQPNPASALNAEAGALLQEDWDAFCRRARLMTGIHAQVPRELRQSVEEAKARGEEKLEERSDAEKDAAQSDMAAEEQQRAWGKGKGRRSTKGKSKPTQKASVAAAAEMEENVGSRRESDDWIPAPASLSTPAPPAINTAGTSAAAGSFEMPSTPLASIQTPGTANAPVRITRHTAASLAQQATYQTPQLAVQSSHSPERPSSSSSSHGSLNGRLNTLSFGWAPEKAAGAPRFSPEAARRERHEMRRFKAAGYCLKRYNRGAFGPRRGLKRL